MQEGLFLTIGVWLRKFFRQKISQLSSDQISELLSEYESDVKNIRKEALQLSWYMRGGLSYDDALTLSIQDREIIKKIIDDNMETTKKSGLPFF